jgi:hypothetical protein
MQLPPAEVRYAAELTALQAVDSAARPAGWQLSPPAVVDFIAGTSGERIRPSVACESNRLGKSICWRSI